ncbi:hypothetical protein CONLIGDRAFT_675045 [Coniochaeta ligniaria NRRL 30616]|uniref:Amidohydrolase-related domain-containing protein n=1 Tax=Coniochaeta ligniaria NRRL 30616 TaxID=1408157 RepID=A0A1J7I4E7_9PEZI|nr:hypothetical protein CONLIGDRAFT_675045 [Coniochaeta ligniaria NRRL 30616]
MKRKYIFAALTIFQKIGEACLAHLPTRSDTSHSLVRRSASAPRTKTAIQNVRVFDGEGFSDMQTIIIAGEIMGTNTSNIETVVDAGGRFLIPGLIDAHVHVNDLQGLEDLTSYGVTTGMIMSCLNYTMCASLHGLEGLASFISAGIGATGPGSQHAKTFHLNPSQLIYPTDDPAAVVSYTFGNGSDFYKITAEVLGPSQDMQTALVEEVHKLGKQSMTHAATISAWQDAVASRTDGIQHTASDGLFSSALLAQAVQNGQFNTPTMAVFKYGFSNPVVQQFLGVSIGPGSNNSYDNVLANVFAVYKAGIPVLAGTDAVGTLGPNLSLPFGVTLHHELQNLVEAGLKPVEALRAATSLSAHHHRLTDRGLIAPGMRADLVLLNSNPLVNISNTLDIARVWVGGVEYLDVVKGVGSSNASGNASAPAAATGTPPTISGAGLIGFLTYSTVAIFIGFGCAIDLLHSLGIPARPDDRLDSRSGQSTGIPWEINPVTGQGQDIETQPSFGEMTDAEKHREAERLFVLFER